MDEMMKNAKMSVLEKLKSAAGAKGMSGMKGMKKVSVMSDSDKGLEEGLDVAEEMTSGDKLEPVEKPSKVDMIDLESFSPEECDELMEKLLAKKAEYEGEAGESEESSEELF